MAINASLTLENNTGESLKVVAFTKINDDARFGGVELGQEIGDGGNAQFFMSNQSFGLAPEGVGVQVTVVNATVTRYITVRLAIPASGTTDFSAESVQGIRMEPDSPNFGKQYTAKLS